MPINKNILHYNDIEATVQSDQKICKTNSGAVRRIHVVARVFVI